MKPVREPSGPVSQKPFKLDKHQVKLGIYAFLIVLLISMLSIKPYLPRALLHHAVKIDDYQHFANRVVLSGTAKLPWERAQVPIPEPDPKTQTLLSGLETTALLVLENGKIGYEKYSAGGGPEVLSGSFSMAEGILSLLAGFALQDHRIKSLDEPVSTYLTEWEGREEGKMTIKNLLTMTSGLKWHDSLSNAFSNTTEAYYGTNLSFTALKQRAEVDPGTRFKAQRGTSELLGLLVSRAVNLSLAQYASLKLWIPLGAEKDALWSLDHEEGVEKAFCCFNATARDFARIAEFVRLGGVWQGRALLNPEYFKAMTKPNGIVDETGKISNSYGYQWWILPTSKGEIYYAQGMLGQYLIVLPQKNRVVVRLGKQAGKLEGGHPEEVLALVNWLLQ